MKLSSRIDKIIGKMVKELRFFLKLMNLTSSSNSALDHLPARYCSSVNRKRRAALKEARVHFYKLRIKRYTSRLVTSTVPYIC